MVNIVIRNLNQFLIEGIGYDTRSEVTTTVMVSVFYTAFINTGILSILTNADMYYMPVLSRLLPFLRGQYADIDRDWYLMIGTGMVKTIGIMAFFPWAELFMYGGLRKFKQWRDGGKLNLCGPSKNVFAEDFEGDVDDDQTTKCTTQSQYIQLYAGMDYLMHFKYSSVLVMVYVSFMFGMFIPMLFPVTLVGIANLYITEKWALTYFYRKPPVYDELISQAAFRLLKHPPVLMFALGYWALGNMQIFNNDAADVIF